jgi:hypothetical protein
MMRGVASSFCGRLTAIFFGFEKVEKVLNLFLLRGGTQQRRCTKHTSTPRDHRRHHHQRQTPPPLRQGQNKHMTTEGAAAGHGQDELPDHLTGEGLSEKVGELEERARRLAAEELEELLRGRALNIITGSATPMKTPGGAAAGAGAGAAEVPPAAVGSKI